VAATLFPIGIVITVVAIAWMLLVVFRRRYLWRMGSRHFSRRPTETLLVVLGSVLGTALITGSFITSDSLTSSFTAEVYKRMGEVDEQVILVNSQASQNADRKLDELRSDPLIDGAAKVTNETATTRSLADPSKTEPRTEVFALNLADLDSFGTEKQALGGPNLSGDEAVLTKELADELGVGVGDQIELLIYGRSENFRVARVISGSGFAAYQDGYDIYVGKDTLTQIAKDAGRRAPTTELWVSNAGDRKDGVDASNLVAARLESVLGSDGVKVIKTKQSGVTAASDAGENIGSLFLVIGTFAVIAGILLLVNIFVMLATERRSELGMLRAVGMKRADLVRGFALEGSMYGFAAAIAGGAVGIGVGAAIVQVASAIFSTGGLGRGALSLSVVLLPNSIMAGVVVGFAISFVTIAITSWRISRVNIIAAVRDLDEAKLKQHRVRSLVIGLVVTAVGAALAVSGFVSITAVPAIIGPAMVAGGLTSVLSRWFPQRAVITVMMAALLAWNLSLSELRPGILGRQVSPGVFVVYGTVAVVAAVTLLAQNQEVLAGGVRHAVRANPRRGLALRLATTYPIAKRFRTAMTLVMYALIVFTLTMISTIAHVNERNIDSIKRRESSGYDVMMHTNGTTAVQERDVLRVPGVVGAVPLVNATAQLKADGKETTTVVTGVDDKLLDLSTWELDKKSSEYADAESVWRALANDSGVIALSRRLERGSRGGPPGEVQTDLDEEIEIGDPLSGKSEKRKVIAFVSSFNTMPGAVIATRQVESDFLSATKSTWLVRADPAVGAKTVAQRLDAEFVDDGVEAVSFAERINEVMKLNLQFFTLLRGYLALGLVIGIIGLGVIMVRAVRERRRAIGILRALGFGASTVRRAFVGEAGIVATEGIVIGIFLGLVTARNLLSSDIAKDFDVPFAVPWLVIAILASLAFVFSLIVAALPARQAAKIRPAVALRVAD